MIPTSLLRNEPPFTAVVIERCDDTPQRLTLTERAAVSILCAVSLTFWTCAVLWFVG